MLAIRDLRQRVALGMEVDLNIVDLLEVGTGAALLWHAFVWARVIQLPWRACVVSQWFVEGDLRSYTLHMARAVAEHQQAPSSPLPPVAPPPRVKTGRSGPIGLPSACLQLRRSRAELAHARQETAEGMAGTLDPPTERKGRSTDRATRLGLMALEAHVPVERVAHSHDGFSRTCQKN